MSRYITKFLTQFNFENKCLAIGNYYDELNRFKNLIYKQLDNEELYDYHKELKQYISNNFLLYISKIDTHEENCKCKKMYELIDVEVILWQYKGTNRYYFFNILKTVDEFEDVVDAVQYLTENWISYNARYLNITNIVSVKLNTPLYYIDEVHDNLQNHNPDVPLIGNNFHLTPICYAKQPIIAEWFYSKGAKITNNIYSYILTERTAMMAWCFTKIGESLEIEKRIAQALPFTLYYKKSMFAVMVDFYIKINYKPQILAKHFNNIQIELFAKYLHLLNDKAKQWMQLCIKIFYILRNPGSSFYKPCGISRDGFVMYEEYKLYCSENLLYMGRVIPIEVLPIEEKSDESNKDSLFDMLVNEVILRLNRYGYYPDGGVDNFDPNAIKILTGSKNGKKLKIKIPNEEKTKATLKEVVEDTGVIDIKNDEHNLFKKFICKLKDLDEKLE